LNYKDNRITKSEKKNLKSQCQFSRIKINYSNLEMPLMLKSNSNYCLTKNQKEQFRRSKEYKYKNNYLKITNFIHKEKQNFLNNLYNCSQKNYKTFLKDTLEKQKYKETYQRKQKKIQDLNNNNIQKSLV